MFSENRELCEKKRIIWKIGNYPKIELFSKFKNYPEIVSSAKGSILKCCILTLDWAVNQRFSKQDTHMKISGSSHVVNRKCVSVTKWYMQMPTWRSQAVGISVSLESVPAYSHWERLAGAAAHSRPPVEYIPTEKQK